MRNPDCYGRILKSSDCAFILLVKHNVKVVNLIQFSPHGHFSFLSHSWLTMTLQDFSYSSKLNTTMILLPSSILLFCSSRNRCVEIELLWLLWGRTKQNGAGRSQHFSSILCSRAKETEHHRWLYVVSIIFFMMQTHLEVQYVLSHSTLRGLCCPSLPLDVQQWALQQSVQDALIGLLKT